MCPQDQNNKDKQNSVLDTLTEGAIDMADIALDVTLESIDTLTETISDIAEAVISNIDLP